MILVIPGKLISFIYHIPLSIRILPVDSKLTHPWNAMMVEGLSVLVWLDKPPFDQGLPDCAAFTIQRTLISYIKDLLSCVLTLILPFVIRRTYDHVW